jgi:VanZ family protein
MPEMDRHCIFCGHDGKLTSEHIWGDWVTKYVPRTMNKHHFANTLSLSRQLFGYGRAIRLAHRFASSVVLVILVG